MAKPLLISRLSVTYGDETVVSAADCLIAPGECVGLIGESGSGKSTLALAVMGLLGPAANTCGTIRYGDQNLLTATESELNQIRWNKIAIVFQNSLDVLNPVMTVGDQIAEGIILHQKQNKTAAAVEAARYLGLTGLDPKWATAYPHQLSGGMRQKVLIAMALSCQPELLIVDEPTMALDAAAKAEIVALLKRLQSEHHFSMLVISHEFPVVSALAARTMVMYGGCIVEVGEIEALLAHPRHPYTRGLISSSPSVNPYRDMWGIPGNMQLEKQGCPFYARCVQRVPHCQAERPGLTGSGDRLIACHLGGIQTVLRGDNLSKAYRNEHHTVEACKRCSLEIKSGEVVALIGESGSGKTTLGNLLAGIIHSDQGTIEFLDRTLHGHSETSRKHGVQIVFQDPFSATNEHLTIESIVREPLDILQDRNHKARREAVIRALKQVQMPHDQAFLERKGHTLSGGQRQRISVARALTMAPKLLIADEISAMLDPSTAANLIRLLKGLQNSMGFSMLFITHDIALAQKISDMIYVMKNGEIIEHGPAQKVLVHPAHEYTRYLVSHAAITGFMPA